MNNKNTCPIDKWKAIDNFPVAMAYVPWQYWENVYEADKALQQGTLFPELDKPFLGCRGGRK